MKRPTWTDCKRGAEPESSVAAAALAAAVEIDDRAIYQNANFKSGLPPSKGGPRLPQVVDLLDFASPWKGHALSCLALEFFREREKFYTLGAVSEKNPILVYYSQFY